MSVFPSTPKFAQSSNFTENFDSNHAKAFEDVAGGFIVFIYFYNVLYGSRDHPTSQRTSTPRLQGQSLQIEYLIILYQSEPNKIEAVNW